MVALSTSIVRASKGVDNKIFYNCTVKGKDSSGSPITKIYRTVKNISEFGADAIRGRGTPAYEIKEVDNGMLKGDTLALKDCWVDNDRELEGDILANILLDCKDEERELFLTLFIHGLVEVDGTGTKDHIRAIMLRGLDVHQDNIKYQIEQLDEDMASPNKVSSGLSRSRAFAPIDRILREDKKNQWKHHYRIIFKEVGISMYEIRSIRDAFQALIDVTKGLEIACNSLANLIMILTSTGSYG